MSVLTAWAAGKFDAERIAKDAKRFEVGDKVSKNNIVFYLESLSDQFFFR